MVLGEGFANVDLDPGESELRWFMASGDIRNALQCLLIPPSLGRYFTLPALFAKAAGLVGRRVEGRKLAFDSVSLFPASLPMGFTQSCRVRHPPLHPCYSGSEFACLVVVQ